MIYQEKEISPSFYPENSVLIFNSTTRNYISRYSNVFSIEKLAPFKLIINFGNGKLANQGDNFTRNLPKF